MPGEYRVVVFDDAEVVEAARACKSLLHAVDCEVALIFSFDSGGPPASLTPAGW